MKSENQTFVESIGIEENTTATEANNSYKAPATMPALGGSSSKESSKKKGRLFKRAGSSKRDSNDEASASRITSLEKELAEKDQRIADLQQTVRNFLFIFLFYLYVFF